MKRIPERPDIGHLKKQAKDLLALHRGRDPAALPRWRASLPAARGLDDAALAARDFRLHDAQSCVAREHGFASWAELSDFVALRRAQADDPARTLQQWLGRVYAGDIAGGLGNARATVAARLLDASPSLRAMVAEDPCLACAVGDEAALRRASARDPGWVHRAGGPLRLPPLVALTHSALLALPAWRAALHACARFLLDAGASPDQAVGSRWPPGSLEAPDGNAPLSALYGAAGRAFDPVLTQMLLDAGAHPDDGESLYHALASPECVRRLLAAGARVGGTNAMYAVLDLDRLDSLRLLLAHGGDPNEPPSGPPTADWGSPLLWAIRRRRSAAHVRALLDAGARADACMPDGTPARTLALRYGLVEVARLLAGPVHTVAPPATEAFVATCARGDTGAAGALRAAHPDVVDRLDAAQRRMLPELAAQPGCGDAVRAMVANGWPIEERGGDWDASALNHAVFRGDAALTRFLLRHGADWRTRHGWGDDVCGTLSWASLNAASAEGGPEDGDPEGGDWPGCAQALAAHGLPPARPDPSRPDGVLIGERPARFSDAVTEALLDAAAWPGRD